MKYNKRSANNFDVFFITLLDSRTNRNTAYLKLPTSNCFQYFIKEILRCVDNEESNSRIADHSQKLINNFYEYMLKDRILREIDYLAYSKLLLNLKKFSENAKINNFEKHAFFDKMNKHYVKEYRKKTYEILKTKYNDNCVDDDAYIISDIF